jgi:hypothetical protein
VAAHLHDSARAQSIGAAGLALTYGLLLSARRLVSFRPWWLDDGVPSDNCLGSMLSTLAWDRSSGGSRRGAGCGVRGGLLVKGADGGLQGPRKVKRTGDMH